MTSRSLSRNLRCSPGDTARRIISYRIGASRLGFDVLTEIDSIVAVVARASTVRPAAIDVFAVGWAGLALRVYMQSPAYRREVRQVAFVGTPHRGVPADSTFVFGRDTPCASPLGARPAVQNLGTRVRSDASSIAALNLGSGEFRPWPAGVPILNVSVGSQDALRAKCDGDARPGAVPPDSVILRLQRFPVGAHSSPLRPGILDTVLTGRDPFQLTSEVLGAALSLFSRPGTAVPVEETQWIGSDSIILPSTGGSPRPTPVVLRSACRPGAQSCPGPRVATLFALSPDPVGAADLSDLRSIIAPSVPSARSAASGDSARIILARQSGAQRTSAFLPLDAGLGLMSLPTRPGAFRYRDIFEEQGELCVQGEGERRVLSLRSYCDIALLISFPPLSRWAKIRTDSVEFPIPPASDSIGRGLLFRSTSRERFDLRLQSPAGSYPLDSLERIEIELIGPVVEDSMRVRFGWIGQDSVARWSDGAEPARRVPSDSPRGYARYVVSIDKWARDFDLDRRQMGQGALLLHIRGPSSVGRGGAIRVFVTPVSRPAARQRGERGR